jgi:DnaJ family protein C protein 12
MYELCIQEAKDTLCDPEKRATYDKWKNSGVAVSYKTWLSNKEHFHQVTALQF